MLHPKKSRWVELEEALRYAVDTIAKGVGAPVSRARACGRFQELIEALAARDGKTKTDIFLFEFKLNGTAKKAIAQIREKRYFERFMDDGRRITLVGVAFSRKTRNLGRWLIEPMDVGSRPEECAVRE